MPSKVTALNDVIVAVVAALNAANLGYPVFDGPPTQRPGRTITHFACIGLEELPPQDGEVASASMDQAWYGLGEKARLENLHIECIAVGKSPTAAAARLLAVNVVQDVANNIALHPSNETYNALVSAVTSTRVGNLSGGSIVIMQFTISANARLV